MTEPAGWAAKWFEPIPGRCWTACTVCGAIIDARHQALHAAFHGKREPDPPRRPR
jgi:hypothetical protein